MASEKPKTNPFRLWGLYLLLLLLLLSPVLFNYLSPVKSISWQQFEQDILSRKAVEKIVITNGERADIYLKSSFLEDSVFGEVLRSPLRKGIREGPHYSVTIGSVESFERKLEEAQRNFPAEEKTPVTYKNQSGWFWNILSWMLTFVLIFTLWNFIL